MLFSPRLKHDRPNFLEILKCAKDVYVYFLDLEKAYDRVPREML